MARGWESKSVEAQVEAAEAKPASAGPTTPEEAARRRERETLRMARARVMQQLELAQEPRYIKQLNDALAALDSRISKLR